MTLLKLDDKFGVDVESFGRSNTVLGLVNCVVHG